ncbi:MAG TPA: class I tRNA ligase family protein [Candidatus Paceibacterota bacterium]|nr:class I tRNA ligase family protein [Candidatus Paceibacterota bacterium]HPT18072.1 class I tRNA ligase family protein [Candidatus Paceibacterota bacterium]
MDKEENKNKSEIAKKEEAVLKFWKENKIFEKSLEKEAPSGDFVFYEGPPTANGKPGIHHLEARAFKDVIPRYKTMKGYYVRRKGGWDTHGLPVELQVEKELGLKSKKEIEEYGVAKFNKKCKESVWQYVDLWEKFTERIGFWVDQKNPYVTYHNNYIESVWNVVKEVDKQKLLYKDYKVVPWCPRCGTALSSHELAQGYQDVKDLSVYVKFKLKVGQKIDNFTTTENTYIIAWTTTPWTLPGNVALAINKNVKYWIITKTENDGTRNSYIFSPDTVVDKNGPKNQNLMDLYLMGEAHEERVLNVVKGKDLIGLEYEPLYPFLKEQLEKKGENLEKSFKVYPASFVTTEDGTGVVHTAVMYGQDDFMLGTEIGLPKHHLVGLDGKFLAGTGFLEGRFVRDEDVAVDIIKDLAHRELLLKKEKYEHSYPHCWRCKTALIYYARDSWYIKMSSLRDKLVKENEGINWEPAHIKEGRFGEWLREIKDWAISRERYWGTPLPVWTCSKCGKLEVIGSVADLKEKTKKSGNRYFVMRHGEAMNNIAKDNVNSRDIHHSAKLTENGKEQVIESAKNFKEKIDIIISSPFERTKETAEIFCKQTGFPIEKVIFDDRIKEMETSNVFDKKDRSEFKKYYDLDYLDSPKESLPGGESFAELVKRVGEFLYEIEKKYNNKNILIIGHQGSTSRAISFIVKGLSFSDLSSKHDPLVSINNAEIKEFGFVSLPHDEDYMPDLHKPYIDEAELICSNSTGSGQVCGGKLERTKEVMDVWLDSGTMPFSQDHYPFDFAKGGLFENKNLKYPADFISEAIDQTRGWFYTLHAVGTLMGRGKAYKNVICLGLLLDANGKKMSKSIGNVVDPWSMINKYGVDTLRLWMYGVNQPGESKNFDEKTVVELHRQVFGLLYNVLAFYELYRDIELEKLEYKKSENILDQWIVSKLDELNILCVENMDNYRVLEPTRAIRDFINDLSTWYLRRSRDRIKEEASRPITLKDYGEARQTLYFVLKNLSKIIAPFAPFTAEDIWLKLKNFKDEESIHLASWPENKKVDQEIIKNMEDVRKIVSIGLEKRQKGGIPVRQPLAKMEIKNLSLDKKYLELIKDELNVKDVLENKNIETEVLLDMEITLELKEEGNYREFVRAVQDMRKKAGLTPNDNIVLFIKTQEDGEKLIKKFEKDIKKTVLASEIKFSENQGEEIKIDNLVFRIKIEK